MQNAARRQIKSMNPHSTVEKRRPAGHAVCDVFLYQHAAVDGPGGFKLPVDTDESFLRRGTGFPSQTSIGRCETINPSISGAKEYAALMQRWRCRDAAACRILPMWPACLEADRVNGSRVALGYNDGAVGGDGRRQRSADLRRPFWCQIVRQL